MEIAFRMRFGIKTTCQDLDFCTENSIQMAEDLAINDPLDRKCKLRTLNEMITCKICHGYLVDATTVTECLHTFCKSCIVKHLEDSNECPECEDIIHQSHPLDYISYDRTLQDLVYKIVPGKRQSFCVKLKCVNFSFVYILRF